MNYFTQINHLLRYLLVLKIKQSFQLSDEQSSNVKKNIFPGSVSHTFKCYLKCCYSKCLLSTSKFSIFMTFDPLKPPNFEQ